MAVDRSTRITFARLTDIAPDVIIAHMSDPRIAEHMPLLTDRWDRQRLDAFVALKEAYWRRDGLGHWAILADGAYAGWGGFQKEDGEWDFGLVLKPEYFGLGPRIVSAALTIARADVRIPRVTFLLPRSRLRLRALDRIGAVFVGEVEHSGAQFSKFQLDTA